MIIKLLEFLIHKYFIFFLKSFIYLKGSKNKLKQKTNKNSIAVINTFDQAGGAANLAFALTKEIMNLHDAKYFVKYKNANKPWIEKIIDFKSTVFSDLLVKEAKKSGWIEFNGLDALNLLKNNFYQTAKIVHLHNLHGDFFSPALFPYLLKNKKTIWTIHDEAFITGHCSCTLGCNKWKMGCGNCPDLTIYPPVLKDNTKKVLKMKKKWIQQMNPMIITPSYWLEQRVRMAYPALKTIKTIRHTHTCDRTHIHHKPLTLTNKTHITRAPTHKNSLTHHSHKHSKKHATHTRTPATSSFRIFTISFCCFASSPAHKEKKENKKKSQQYEH